MILPLIEGYSSYIDTNMHPTEMDNKGRMPSSPIANESKFHHDVKHVKEYYLLYICYTYSDIEVGLCLKALVTYLTLGHIARARVILMQKITN